MPAAHPIDPTSARNPSRMHGRVAVVLAALLALVAGVAGARDRHGGHYVLTGLPGVGSELLLRDKGRFEWYMVRGGGQQTVRGTWRKRGGRIVLEADRPASYTGEQIQLRESTAWDSALEDRLRAVDRAREADEQRARCPFLRYSDDGAPASLSNLPPSAEERRHAAADTLRPLEEAIAQLEFAAKVAVSAPSDMRAQQVAADAMDAYQRAWRTARDMHWAAGLEPPARARLPRACERVEGVRETGGVAVRLVDPQSRAVFSGARIDFEFDTGAVKGVLTDASGWALARKPAGATLRAVVVQPAEGVPAARIAAPAGGDAMIMTYAAAAGQRLPFETLELRIDGDALVPVWPAAGESGRYVRR